MKKLALVAALVAAATVPALAQGLEVEVVSARRFMVAFEINENAQVCGDNQINSTTTALVWNAPGGSDDIAILPGAAGISQAGDINSFGDVSGWHESAATGIDTAVVWYADGGYQDFVELGLPSDVYLYTQAYALNDSGVVSVTAGLEAYVQPGDDPFGLAQDPYRWTAEDGFQALPHLSGARESLGLSVAADGTIAGYSVGEDGAEHAVLWTKNGKIQDLGFPEGTTLGAIAQSINDSGMVVGHDARRRDSWVWTKKNGFVALEDFGFNAEARDVNNHGIVAGVADVFPFDPAPVVWDADGNIYNIRDIAGFNDYYFIDGVAINDNNEFVAYGINLQNGNRDAVVLQLTFVD